MPYNEQGLIYFTCMNIKKLPKEEQQRIRSLCYEVAGDYAEALYMLLTDDTKNVNAVSMRYYLSSSQLYEYRRRFYERYAEHLGFKKTDRQEIQISWYR